MINESKGYMESHYQVLIIGGGTAGIMTAAQILKKKQSISIAIIEPADTHYYQPAWTLVGAGTYDFKKTGKPMKDVMPQGIKWIKDLATFFKPEKNTVKTKASGALTYDYLVVSPGLVMEPSLIEGLTEALDKGVVCSNYTDPNHTWDVIKKFKGGNAIFTQPTTPIKCGGAPQKIAYLASDYFRKKGILKNTNVIFATPGSVIFGVKPIRDTLMKVIGRYGINFKPFYAPFKIDAEKQIAYFKHVAPAENKCIVNEDNDIGEISTDENIIQIPFDMLHLAPPQSAPDFIKKSKIAHQDGPSKGWIDVNKYTLQSNKYANVFALGDSAALPTAKTGAAVRKQAPVVVENLFRVMNKETTMQEGYHGYSSCPLVTGYGKMVLAEFKYDNIRDSDPLISTFMDTGKESYLMWLLKKYGLPILYWEGMMKGRM